MRKVPLLQLLENNGHKEENETGREGTKTMDPWSTGAMESRTLYPYNTHARSVPVCRRLSQDRGQVVHLLTGAEARRVPELKPLVILN